MSELNQIIWDFFQFKKIWTHSSILHIIQIQHANNASNKRNNHDTLNIDSNVKCMNEFSAIMRWAHKENAEQNEDSNQHASLHHDIHLKSHASNSVSHIQCSDQISLDIWSCSLTHRSEHKQIENDTLKLQEWTDQETSQDTKQIFMSCSWCIQDHTDNCSRNRNTHFSVWSVFEY